MFRLALLALGVSVAVLVGLSLLPRRAAVTPGGAIRLTGAAVTLYPQADPEAVWRFDADRVVYEPSTQETTLQSIADAARSSWSKPGTLRSAVSAVRSAGCSKARELMPGRRTGAATP